MLATQQQKQMVSVASDGGNHLLLLLRSQQCLTPIKTSLRSLFIGVKRLSFTPTVVKGEI
jgi:hypothetical protein